MSGWLIKGWHTRPHSDGLPVFTEQGQCLTNVLEHAKAALESGCNEIIILKRGDRDAREKGAPILGYRIHNDSAVDRRDLDG